MDQKNDTGLRRETPPKSSGSSPSSEPTPIKPIDLTEDDDDVIEVDHPGMKEPEVKEPQVKASNPVDDIEIEYTMPSRRRLRPPRPNTSLKALENALKPIQPRSRSKKQNAVANILGADPDLTPPVSNRAAIRQEIASKTAAYRDRFFVEKKEFWLPLLPESNYVRKLVKKYERMTEVEKARLPTITPYTEIESQPRGVRATMKPYQLSGLSFMVYLHRNVTNAFVFTVGIEQ
jgi:SWI/SNF-related matrix-associated actin-dependent regulator of chromatin subfamily A member 5